MKKLTKLQLDCLQEAGNIGIGHAAIALSQMLGKKIMIAVTRSDMVPSDVFLKNLPCGKDDDVAGIYLHTLGDVKGAAVFFFDKDSTLKLCEMMLRKPAGTLKFVDEKGQSALRELGSILTGAFLSVLADMLSLNVFHKTPMFAMDSAKAITLGVCRDVFGDEKKRQCLASEFIESASKITGSFAFIPTDDSMQKIIKGLDRLGKSR